MRQRQGGGHTDIACGARIIAATNEDLKADARGNYLLPELANIDLCRGEWSAGSLLSEYLWFGLSQF